MSFDLGRAMRKKGEYESARLDDFAFRCRARATRLLAADLKLGEGFAGRLVATAGEAEALALVAAESGRPLEDVEVHYRRHLVDARAALIAERGDPTPHRLA